MMLCGTFCFASYNQFKLLLKNETIMTTNFNSMMNTFKSASLVVVMGVLMACQGETIAQTVDETKYKPVTSTFSVSTGDKIEVVELFWFGCGHCFALEPHVKTWLKDSKPDNVEFVKVPALFSKRWEFHGQAFYTMEILGVEQEVYDAFFKSIHVNRKPINNLNSLVDFMANFGKSKEEVESAFNSFAVDTKMRNARKITRASGARGVPAMVVDGKYLTSQQNAGGTKELFDVVNQLAAKAAAER